MMAGLPKTIGSCLLGVLALCLTSCLNPDLVSPPTSDDLTILITSASFTPLVGCQTIDVPSGMDFACQTAYPEVFFQILGAPGGNLVQVQGVTDASFYWQTYPVNGGSSDLQAVQLNSGQTFTVEIISTGVQGLIEVL
jgi:hypothetical protein